MINNVKWHWWMCFLWVLLHDFGNCSKSHYRNKVELRGTACTVMIEMHNRSDTVYAYVYGIICIQITSYIGIHSMYIQHRTHLALYIAASHWPIHPHKTAWRHWQISNLTCNILLCKLLLIAIRYILARQMRCKTTPAHCIIICICIVMTNLYSGLWISF